MSHDRDPYEDCASCVFRGREPAICDECDDADQWEPDEDFVDAAAGAIHPRTPTYLMKKAA